MELVGMNGLCQMHMDACSAVTELALWIVLS